MDKSLSNLSLSSLRMSWKLIRFRLQRVEKIMLADDTVVICINWPSCGGETEALVSSVFNINQQKYSSSHAKVFYWCSKRDLSSAHSLNEAIVQESW